MAYRDVLITVSNQTIVQKYYARSYPMNDRDHDGRSDKYEVPVYKVFIKGVDSSGTKVVKEWTALRFMPFWNDPQNPSSYYKSKGFISSGLITFPKQIIKNYLRGYEIHNTTSPEIGAIQLKGNFLIHAGPVSLAQAGWGSAGCIEIIGNFTAFRREILQLANCFISELQSAMESIVNARKLSVEIEHAASPIFKQIGNFR